MKPSIHFREYQLPVFLDNETGVLVLHWSRQIGKSFTLAACDAVAWRPWRISFGAISARKSASIKLRPVVLL